MSTIVTRLGSIEELAGMDMLCSDKTGTLTLGKMQMKDILVYEKELNPRDILKFSALAAKWYEPVDFRLRSLMYLFSRSQNLPPLPVSESIFLGSNTFQSL